MKAGGAAREGEGELEGGGLPTSPLNPLALPLPSGKGCEREAKCHVEGSSLPPA